MPRAAAVLSVSCSQCLECAWGHSRHSIKGVIGEKAPWSSGAWQHFWVPLQKHVLFLPLFLSLVWTLRLVENSILMPSELVVLTSVAGPVPHECWKPAMSQGTPDPSSPLRGVGERTSACTGKGQSGAALYSGSEQAL